MPMNTIRGMDPKIVSEDIEMEEQFRTMENPGINFIRGYYFSKPLPADEFPEFIKKSNKGNDILHRNIKARDVKTPALLLFN